MFSSTTIGALGTSVNTSVTLSVEVIQEAPLLCKNITASLGCLSTLESEDCQHLSGLYSSLVMLVCHADSQHTSEEQRMNNVCWTKSFEPMPFQVFTSRAMIFIAHTTGADMAVRSEIFRENCRLSFSPTPSLPLLPPLLSVGFKETWFSV